MPRLAEEVKKKVLKHTEPVKNNFKVPFHFSRLEVIYYFYSAFHIQLSKCFIIYTVPLVCMGP